MYFIEIQGLLRIIKQCKIVILQLFTLLQTTKQYYFSTEISIKKSHWLTRVDCNLEIAGCGCSMCCTGSEAPTWSFSSSSRRSSGCGWPLSSSSNSSGCCVKALTLAPAAQTHVTHLTTCQLLKHTRPI